MWILDADSTVQCEMIACEDLSYGNADGFRIYRSAGVLFAEIYKILGKEVGDLGLEVGLVWVWCMERVLLTCNVIY